MDFGFSEEQELLRQQVRKFFEEQCPLEEVRRIMAGRGGYAKEQWKQLAELGFLGLTVSEEHGGAGLGWVDLVVMLEETGRALFPSPLLSTTLFAQLLSDVGTVEQQSRWLPAIANGSAIGTVAVLEQEDYLAADGIALRATPEAAGFRLSGEKCFVTDVAQASVFAVAFRTGNAAIANGEDLALALIEADAPGVSFQSTETLDETKCVGSLRLDDVSVSQAAMLDTIGSAWPSIQRHLERGAAAVTAEIIGSLQAVLDITVQFAKDRVQFGNPIGHYQGVKHPLAEIYVDIECLRSLLYFAAWALDSSPDDVPQAVSEAKAFASEAFTNGAIEAIQLHGAVGYTAEYDIQLYLKRSKWSRPLFGDEEHHYDRLAALGGY